jgi:hypothetical protein
LELKKIDGNEFSSIFCLGSMVDYCWELLVWHKGWSGAEFGRYSTGASIIMPALTGIIADRWITEKLYGILHILSGFAIFIYKLLTLLFSIG